jgi:hypothetical protein
MAPAQQTGGWFRRHRLLILAGLAAAWVGGITMAHFREESRGRGTNKGAKELLQIGALPVT